jgi:hypothetical protein
VDQPRFSFAEAVRRDPDRSGAGSSSSTATAITSDTSSAQHARSAWSWRSCSIIVHVLEYLWKAAYAFQPAGTTEAETWVENRFLSLLKGQSGPGLAYSLWQMIKIHALDENAARPVERATKFLVRNAAFLHYDRALADGLPIATGVIEGACRYLVQDCMGRTGARWSLAGAEAILRLRALRTSGDFDDYWQFHLAKEYEHTHQIRLRGRQGPQSATAHATAPHAGQVIGTVADDAVMKELHPSVIG